MKRKLGLLAVIAVVVALSSCKSTQKAYGTNTDSTITLNLAEFNGKRLFVTHVNGEATGAVDTNVYVNPLYLPLHGEPIVLTIRCAASVIGNRYRTAELTLPVSDVKHGDITSLTWVPNANMFQWQIGANMPQMLAPIFID